MLYPLGKEHNLFGRCSWEKGKLIFLSPEGLSTHLRKVFQIYKNNQVWILQSYVCDLQERIEHASGQLVQPSERSQQC